MKDFPWYASYPDGIPHQIKLYDYNSLTELVEDSFVKFRDHVAFVNMGKSLTYGEVDEQSRDFASFLQNDLGLKKGDKIAIQLPNLLQFPVVFFGALRAGLVAVNTNPLYTPREMEHQFNDSESKAIVILANFAYNLESILPKTSIKHVIVTEIGDMLGGVKGTLVNLAVRYVKRMVPSYQLPGRITLKEALARGAGKEFRRPEAKPEDTVVLQYTGGTTGLSKGAQLSNGNIVAHNAMITAWFQPLLRKEPRGQEIMITAIPMYHIFALTVNGVLMMSVGAKNVLITNPRDMKGFVKELSKHKFTIITGVNTLFNGLMNQSGFEDLDFSGLKGSVAGAMAVQDVVAKRWQKITGSPLVEGYGLSETSPVLCCSPLDGTHKPGTIGLPMPSTEVAVFDDDGNQLPTGEPGELCARGPQVMSGYFNRDNEGVFFPAGWFRTGDIGIMSEDGFFKIVDRKKDMIKVSGFNVYPNEIENIIAGHPKVKEVAAIGIPDEHSGEAIKVFIVRKDPSLTEKEVISFCKENMTKYKIPRHIEFRDDIPKSNVGKVLRRALKEQEVKSAA